MITATLRADLEILSIAPTTPETCWRVADFHRALAGRLMKPEIHRQLWELHRAGLMHEVDGTHWIRSGRETATLRYGKKGEKTQHAKF